MQAINELADPAQHLRGVRKRDFYHFDEREVLVPTIPLSLVTLAGLYTLLYLHAGAATLTTRVRCGATPAEAAVMIDMAVIDMTTGDGNVMVVMLYMNDDDDDDDDGDDHIYDGGDDIYE